MYIMYLKLPCSLCRTKTQIHFMYISQLLPFVRINYYKMSSIIPTLSAVLRSRWPSPQLTTNRAGFSFEASPVPTTIPWSGSTMAGKRENRSLFRQLQGQHTRCTHLQWYMLVHIHETATRTAHPDTTHLHKTSKSQLLPETRASEREKSHRFCENKSVPHP